MKTIRSLILLALSGAAAGWSVVRLCLRTAEIDWISCFVLHMNTPSAWYFYAAAAGALLLTAGSLRAPQKNAPLFLPLLGLAVPLPGVWGFPVAIILWSWAALRWGAAYAPGLRHWAEKKLSRLPCHTPEFLLVLFWLFVFSWCFYAQYTAFYGGYLIFGDWGQYAEIYRELAFGTFTFKKLLCAAGHFNFFVNVVMSAILRIAPAAETILAVNAFLIASAIPLSFLLLKAGKLSSWSALAAAFAVGINPILSRQILTMFYGFHPIIFFVPLILGFFLFRLRRNKTGMLICFILSLLVQETVAVFWFGWGIYQFIFRKKYKSSILLCAAMAGWFLLSAQKIQPWCAETAAYGQNFHFTRLGNSMGAILLSPLLNPGVFWGTLFSARTLLFGMLLAAPAGFAAFAFPAILITVLPIFCGVCLQESESLKSIMLQYGIETEMMMLCAALLALCRLHRKERSKILDLLLAGTQSRFEQWRGVLASLLAGGITGFLLCGFGYKFNLMPTDQALCNLNGEKVFTFLKNAIPRDAACVRVSNRMRMHLLFEYNTAPVTKEYSPGDWLLLDLTDPFFDPPALIEPLRRKLASDPAAQPVTQASWYSKQFVIWKIGEAPQKPLYQPPPVYPFLIFDRAGVRLETGVPEIAAVYDGRGIHFQIRGRPRCDYDIKIRHGGSNFRYVFGFGLFPAYSLQPGQVWSLPLVQEQTMPELEFVRRPETETR